MPGRTLGNLRALAWLALGCSFALCGCVHADRPPEPGPGGAPTESAKMPLPPYRISPPDLLLVNAVNLLPKPNHAVKPLDLIRVQFPAKSLSAEEMKALADNKLLIDAAVNVDLDGTITIGPPYDLVINIYNMTTTQAAEEIANELKKVANPKLVEKGLVKVRLLQAQGLQLIQGQHLVRPDGSINLGIYGSVFVTGLTVDEARAKIEEHLAHFLQDPTIALDVIGYNSKVYYVIYDGGGLGEQVVRLPVTGNETVLDAVGQVNGLPAVASKSLIWISRPAHDGGAGAILPVDWKAISQRAEAKLNYQMLPGDRLYVKADPLVTLYTGIDRFVSPIERVLGGVILGASTYRAVRTANEHTGGSTSGF